MPVWRIQRIPSGTGPCECKCQRIRRRISCPSCEILSRSMCSRIRLVYLLPLACLLPRSPSVESHHLASQYTDMMTTINPVSLPKELNIQELELMVQWCTATYRSISRNDAVEWIWHAVIPREAMHHPFLMHGILALSALHLAFTSGGATKESYLMTARSHRRQARMGLAKVEANLTESNSNAVFALFNILIVFAFALPLTENPPGDQNPLDELCEVFRLTRTSADTITTAINLVSEGAMKQLVEFDDKPPRMPDTSRLAIMSLSRMNASLGMQNPEHEKEVYDTAIQHLGASLDKLARGGEIMLVAFQWIFQIPPRFIDLLRERRPFALIVLAHYVVIIHSLRGHWWMGEWAARLISHIGQHLCAESKQSINWVLDATGYCIPPL